MPIIHQLSYNSLVRYLRLVYMLPCDVISRYLTLCKLTHCRLDNIDYNNLLLESKKLVNHSADQLDGKA